LVKEEQGCTKYGTEVWGGLEEGRGGGGSGGNRNARNMSCGGRGGKKGKRRGGNISGVQQLKVGKVKNGQRPKGGKREEKGGGGREKNMVL